MSEKCKSVGKLYNSVTGRCLKDTPANRKKVGMQLAPKGPKTCPAGKILSKTGRCVKDTPANRKKLGMQLAPKGPKTCPAGKILSKTGRCVNDTPANRKKAGMQLAPKGPKTCPVGKILSKTGRCVKDTPANRKKLGMQLAPKGPKTCPAGKILSKTGRCVNDTPVNRKKLDPVLNQMKKALKENTDIYNSYTPKSLKFLSIVYQFDKESENTYADIKLFLAHLDTIMERNRYTNYTSEGYVDTENIIHEFNLRPPGINMLNVVNHINKHNIDVGENLTLVPLSDTEITELLNKKIQPDEDDHDDIDAFKINKKQDVEKLVSFYNKHKKDDVFFKNKIPTMLSYKIDFNHNNKFYTL